MEPLQTSSYIFPPELVVLIFLSWVAISKRDMLSFGTAMIGVIVYTADSFIANADFIVIGTTIITAVILLLDTYPDPNQ